MKDYHPSDVEKKWQEKWEKANLFAIDFKKAKKPYFTHVMFPYPSGDKLHVGHWYNFGPADSFARFQRMHGYDVFSPMGFDAFGLPAENYAVKTGVPPQESIPNNIETMIRQLKRIGCMYDWDRMVNTSHPEYYKWTQWLFIQMFMNGLACKKKANVNFCPNCQTVLANEQVWDGKCERCDTDVVQKPMEQWFWKITDYADRLLAGLEKLDWPEKTKTMQRNWIGRKEGIDIRYDVEGARRGIVGPINWPVDEAGLAGDLNRRLTDEWKGRIHSPIRVTHLTFTPHNRKDVFGRQESKTILRILEQVSEEHDICIHEAAIMPDHVHLLVSFTSDRHLEKDVQKKLKGASSRVFQKIYPMESGHLWGEKSHFEDIVSMEQFMSTIAYIQNNQKEASIDPEDRILSKMPLSISCFTTRPDTNFGATFIVLAPEHSFVQKIVAGQLFAKQRKIVAEYVEVSLKKSELERQEEGRKKTGAFTGFYAINNLTSAKMPIWVSDFVLARFGTGAVVGVPGHDKRDFEFATTFDLPVIRVVVGSDGDSSDIMKIEQVQEESGTMVNSSFLDGLDIHEATEKIKDHLEEKAWGTRVTTYRLRDWSIGRQRYWGSPIPIVYDPKGNPHVVPEKHLPWMLPQDVEFKPKGTAPLAQSKELRDRTEKIFGKGWTPEVDTMDTFVCSSYYSFMYLGASREKGEYKQADVTKGQFVDPAVEKKWMPVSMYIGGAEHACMHLIYARFVTMALRDFGFVGHEEPFQRLIHQGVITNQGAKMSKSKGNVVSPDAFIDRYGSDVFRMYLMFMGPFTDGGDWSDTGIKGVDRFVQRIWRVFSEKMGKSAGNAQLQSKLHATIKKVSEDIEELHFNTAISALMELLNALEDEETVSVETAQTFAKLLAPLAPHLADELWELSGGKGFIVDQSWPSYDSKLLIADTMIIAVQVNGKVRGQVELAADASESDIIAAAKELENVKKHLDGKKPKKEVYVKGRLVSLVV